MSSFSTPGATGKKPTGPLPLADLLGQSPGIVAVREKVGRLLQHQPDAHRLPPILIQGETGTGKGLLARMIHRAGPRRDGPFVDVNCAAIPETLLEAELFGFERGAFTDARQAKSGLFQVAHRGMIFLDEVGLLPEGLQGKLLKVLEERAIRRLGSTRSEPLDVWILTATNEDLLTATRERRFREDLYHRLAVLNLWLPPLRDRGGDIQLLAEHFLARACSDYNLPPKTFAPEARPTLQAYPWPGNLRELSNVMERVALLSEAPVVTAEMLELPEALMADAEEVAPGEDARALKDTMGSVEREHLLEALRQTGWNITRAATRLGISRNTLRYRIEKHGLRPRGGPPPARRQVRHPAAPAPAVPAAVPGPAPAPGSVRWEPRRLTLLRAALAVPEATDFPPDPARALAVLVDKVQSFGGRVEELSRLGLVAAFGLEPVEDAPSRAAHAAMAIQKAAERASRGEAERLGVRIGIDVRQLLVGHGSGSASIDLEAKRGAWTHLDRLVAGAEPNTVLVSSAAAPFLERRFELVAAGLREPIPGPVYRLAGYERVGLGPGGRMARFVGRHQELELLQSRLASATKGHGQVIGIVGEAGIGKSRLLYEFRQTLRGEGVSYLEGRCLSHGSAIPYLPVLDMLRSNFRLTEMDSPEAVAAKLRLSLHTIGMEADEAAPYLLQLLGIKEGTERLAVFSPEAIQSRTFAILRRIDLKGSRGRPLVLALEDAHWIDKTSEAYFASLVESLAGSPILMLCTYRPGYQPPWMGKSYADQMALQPLAPPDSLSVVHSVLQTDQVPDRLAMLLLTKAEGNPFFLEELALAIMEHGEPRPTLAVPDTIQEVLLARMNRLADDPKRLLQTASVLGREVPLRLLGMIWEGPGALDPHLQELTRLEFLYEQTGGEDPVIVFKHPLTQEVAYASLPIPRRQAIHARAGRALEGLYTDRLEEAYDRLAYHYSKTEEARKAVEYLARLAEKAARGYAHVEAVTALEEALGHADRLPAPERDRCLLDLILRKAHSLSFLGRFLETLTLLLQHQEGLERRQDPSLAGSFYFWLGHTYSYLGDQERAAQSAERSIGEAARCGDEATMGKAYLVLAQENHWAGQPLEGIERGRRAVDLLERAGERWWLGLAHWVVGINYILAGDFEQALEAEARACAIGEAIGDPRIQSYATWMTGWIHALTGDWEAGIEACKRGLARSPDPVNTAVALGHLGYAYLEKGDLAQAIPLLEQAVAQMGQFTFRRLQGRFTTFLGEAYLANGQVEKARTLVSRSLQITRDAKYWYGVGWAQQAMGRIAQASGSLPEAQSNLQEALHTFISIQARFMAGRTHLALAEVARARMEEDAIRLHLNEAHRLFKALKVPRYAERTQRLAEEFGVPLGEELSGRSPAPG